MDKAMLLRSEEYIIVEKHIHRCKNVHVLTKQNTVLSVRIALMHVENKDPNCIQILPFLVPDSFKMDRSKVQKSVKGRDKQEVSLQENKKINKNRFSALH